MYIKGVQGRGEEVKLALINLGGYVVRDYNYTVSDCLYYINHNEEIRCTKKTTEIGKIIMDNYKEIKLPLLPWNDRDVLVINNYPDCYAAFKKYNDDGTFEAYFVLDHKTVYFDATASVESFHLASIEELEDIPRLFFFLMCNLNEIVLCLPKNVAQNPLPDYMVKRLREEND